METIDHHLAGIEMDELCVERVPSPLLHEDAELAAMCREGIASQHRHINLYRQWLTAWYDIDYEGEITQSAEQAIERVSELFGEEFEDAFLSDLSKHHLQIITRSEHVVRPAYHEQLRQEALMTIVNQSADFAPSRSPVSLEGDHRFRSKPIARFVRSRSPISLMPITA